MEAGPGFSELRFPPPEDRRVFLRLVSGIDLSTFDASRLEDLMKGLRLVMYALDPDTAEQQLWYFGHMIERYSPEATDEE